ncbi:DUF2252 domain-containing protein [Gordonia sp. ABSL1-1]|uniref:DUF2252 domain-containing protein n=1 Tax=Gordonia sp. ABSL1-1 TaxID=3053923 RepID=UPI0025724781|nr:DUF2252 domain-containing protein [Gordonia sp. ABSL1-1]MDL9937568.1 DUF2252 domain-containing protein [Gordonia sp. ABSL1-1]
MSATISVLDIAACPTPAERTDPLSILDAAAMRRVAELVPVRNARMAATPFTFYRGAAGVMAADLATTPNSGIMTQLCGDAHLSNLGLFYTPERRMVFDLNDFDETFVGPFEWDIKRLAASFVVAGRNNGFDDDINRRYAKEVAKAYRKVMRASMSRTTLECWYARVDVDDIVTTIGNRLDTAVNERTQKALRKARHRDSAQAVGKLCEVDADGRLRILSDPPLLVPLTELYPEHDAQVVADRVDERLRNYRDAVSGHIRNLLDQYTVVEMARKVVGVGSVGTRAWIVLLVGQSIDDPLFLQVKEAQRSVLADFVPVSGYAHEGQRVVDGQRLLQASSDIFLGWTGGTDENGERRDFYVRQLRDGKGSVVIEALEPESMKLYARLCGQTLAMAHARTASRAQIAEFLGSLKGFADAIAEFSVAYADLNEKDHAAMLAAIDAGTMEVNDLGAGG